MDIESVKVYKATGGEDIIEELTRDIENDLYAEMEKEYLLDAQAKTKKLLRIINKRLTRPDTGKGEQYE